jgi:low affinity Fe/Cu permease
MRALKQKSESTLGSVASRATKWIGSTTSLIVHTILFAGSFALYFLGFEFDKILLVVTTIVSLEAIYLSIFIQMSVNKHASDLEEVAEDVEEIQEDVEEIQKDVDEIQEDVGEVDILDQKRDEMMLSRIEGTLQMLIGEINELKKQHEENKK